MGAMVSAEVLNYRRSSAAWLASVEQEETEADATTLNELAEELAAEDARASGSAAHATAADADAANVDVDADALSAALGDVQISHATDAGEDDYSASPPQTPSFNEWSTSVVRRRSSIEAPGRTSLSAGSAPLPPLGTLAPAPRHAHDADDARCSGIHAPRTRAAVPYAQAGPCTQA